MCGIVAYKGKHNCLPFLLDGLTKLEYRGYDSAGLSILSGDGLKTYKSIGSVEELKGVVPPDLTGSAGVSHTRWATHGKVCLENCHPFASWDNRLVLVHNGIVENYFKLKQLLKYPERLKGDTDSEVLLCLLSEKYGGNNDLLGAIKDVCSIVDGAFALVILGENGQFIIVRKASSLVVGIGKDGVMVSSDGLSLGKNCEKIIYVPDNSVCDLTNGFDNFLSLENLDSVSYEIEDYQDNQSDADKMGFDHFMLKEIYEQPATVVDCLRGRIDRNNSIKLGGLMGYEDLFNENSHITIVSCGSSYYSGLLGKYFIEELCGIKVSVEHSGEFRYRNNNSIKKNDIFYIKIASDPTVTSPINLRFFEFSIFKYDIDKRREVNLVTAQTQNESFFNDNFTFDVGSNIVQVKDIKLNSINNLTAVLVHESCHLMFIKDGQNITRVPNSRPSYKKLLKKLPSRTTRILVNL